MTRRRVAVVGAGVSGLSATKACLDESLDPVCFEMRQDLGGLWNYSEETDTKDGARIYECLITNTSKWMTSFSDFPFPEDTPPYFSYDIFNGYLKSYAEHFKVIKHIRFNTKVLSVLKADDYDVTGCWNVTTECSGSVRSETFDCVMVGCGFYKVPRLPRIDGIERFQGMKIHSHEYRTHDKYRNKRVLVIGNGSSAGDLAADISHVAKQVYISVGDGCWIIPRRDTGAKPIDLNIRRIYSVLPQFVVNTFLMRKCDDIIDHSAYGIRPESHTSYLMLMVNDDLPTRLLCGKVKVAGRVTSLGENEAVCDDGTVIGSLDCVLFATGYDKDLSVIRPAICSPDGKLECYKMIFPLQFSHNTLALIGCLRTFGPAPPLIEIQCRLAARVLAETHELPSRGVMAKDVDRRNREILKTYGRYNYQFQNVEYRDEIADLLCVKPSIWQFLRNPKMAEAYYFGPSFPVHHRFVGVGRMDHALDVCDVARTDTFPKQLRKVSKKAGHGRMVTVFAMLGVILAVMTMMSVLPL